MPDEKNSIQIEQEFGCLFLGLYGKKHMGLANGASRQWRAAHVHVGGASEVYSVCTRTSTAVQGLAVWRGAQARCDFAEALRFPAVLQCGAQQILLILLILDFRS
jgi:hypothetical protein